MANLKYGSSGSEVEKLQNALIEAGYDVGGTGADGVFGNKTAAAVKQYQKDNGLAVDGIAGKNTLGKLYSTGSNNSSSADVTAKTENGNAGANAAETPTGQVTSANGFTYGDFQYDDFDAMGNEQIKQAWDILQQNQTNKPGSYTPVWQDEADAYLSQYQNRDPFSYDFNSDALYQQYKDQYIQQGQMAMMDTMGQAAAMTGGYGNSYAQTVGQQVYNQHLGQLNAIIPELSQMAFDRYTQEGQELLNMYDLYMNREAQEYGRYQDSLNNWYQENAVLTDSYNTLYDRGWNEYLTGRESAYNEYLTDRNEAFTSSEAQKDRDFTASENEKSRAASKSTGGGSTQKVDTGKTTMAREEQEAYRKSADRAFAESGADGLYAIGEQLEFEGYSQAFIDSWIKSELNRLQSANQQPETSAFWNKQIDLLGGSPFARLYG